MKVNNRADKLTKTERRILVQDTKRTAVQSSVSLAYYLKLKELKKAVSSGSKLCGGCFRTISANKPVCLACSEAPKSPAPAAIAFAASA